MLRRRPFTLAEGEVADSAVGLGKEAVVMDDGQAFWMLVEPWFRRLWGRLIIVA